MAPEDNTITAQREKEFWFDYFSVVVSAENHNPTLLNDDFLKLREIIPPVFELAEPPFISQPVARLRYKQNVEITVDVNRIQFHQSLLGKEPTEPEVPDISSAYIRTLPHVKYTAVGINFAGFVMFENPTDFLRGAFLKENGPFGGDSYELAEISFRVSSENIVSNIKLTPGFIHKDDRHPIEKDRSPVVLLSVNYHHEVTGYPADESVVKAISNWQQLLGDFKELINGLFHLEV